MTASKAMFEAHVRFELDRLSADALAATVRSDIDALFGWLAQATLHDLADPDEVATAMLAQLREPGDTRAGAYLTEVAQSLLEAVDQSPETVGELFIREDARRWAFALAEMEDTRRALIERVTASEAYSRLLAHVLYHGMKGFLLNENLVTRRIPGASQLMRLGQRGIGAAPGLEQSVDRQIIAFINASIAETVKDSQRYLNTTVDADLVAKMADEAWLDVAPRRVSDLLGEVSSDDAEALAELVRAQARVLVDTEFTERVVSGAVRGFFDAHGSRPLAEVLAEVGVTADSVARSVEPTARRAVAHARASGHLEAYVRARLGAFYDSYRADPD